MRHHEASDSDKSGPPRASSEVCCGNSPPSSLPLSTLEHLTICGYRDTWPTSGESLAAIFYSRLQP